VTEVMRKYPHKDQILEGKLKAIADTSSALASQIIELLELRKLILEVQLRALTP